MKRVLFNTNTNSNTNSTNKYILEKQTNYNPNTYLFICLKCHNISDLFLKSRQGPMVKIIICMKGHSMEIALFKYIRQG